MDAIEELTVQECWELLGSARVGRLAVCMSGRPGIFPVNFVVDDETIVFRTAPAPSSPRSRTSASPSRSTTTTPTAARRPASSSTAGPWRSPDADDRDRALGLPLFPWHVAPKGHFVRITADSVSGRRFHAVYAGPRAPSS